MVFKTLYINKLLKVDLKLGKVDFLIENPNLETNSLFTLAWNQFTGLFLRTVPPPFTLATIIGGSITHAASSLGDSLCSATLKSGTCAVHYVMHCKRERLTVVETQKRKVR